MKTALRILCAAGVSLGLAGFASGASAQETQASSGNLYNQTMFQRGLYIGGGLGWATTDGNDDLSWKGLAGWRLNQYLAAQVFYAGLGEHDVPGPVLGDADAETFGAEGLVSFPISETFAIYGKGGAHRFDVDAPGNSDGTSWLGGAGAEMALSHNMSLRGEWTHYDMNSFDDIDDFSAQIVFAF